MLGEKQIQIEARVSWSVVRDKDIKFADNVKEFYASNFDGETPLFERIHQKCNVNKTRLVETWYAYS